MVLKRGYIKIAIIALSFLLAGIGLGLSIRTTCDTADFKYINPDLFCGDSYPIRKNGYATLRSYLVNYIDEQKTNGSVSAVSVYLRDLQDGPTLGIDDHESYAPASLLKLPLLLTYLDASDKVPEILKTAITYQEGDERFSQHFPPTQSIEENKPYTVQQLLEAMIKYSDNRAYFVLLQYIREISPENIDLVSRTLIDLGIVAPKSITDQTVSVRGYASIFSQLYYSSFFSRKELSEQALRLLSDADFNVGIVAGVPEGTTVAHKFGERSGLPGGDVQLHDCGIIYYPRNPYLLCIMTRGKDFDDLAGVIAEISGTVYQEFDSRKL